MNLQSSPFEEAHSQSVYWITPRILVGRYLTPERAGYLRRVGVTHVLNVGDNPSVIDGSQFGFAEIVDVSIVDLTRIPTEIATKCVTTLHSFLDSGPESKAYVHCLAGQRRSPTVVWLYFVARGIDADRARQLITQQAFDAVPGHRALIDDELLQSVINYGQQRFSPLVEDDIRFRAP